MRDAAPLYGFDGTTLRRFQTRSVKPLYSRSNGNIGRAGDIHRANPPSSRRVCDTNQLLRHRRIRRDRARAFRDENAKRRGIEVQLVSCLMLNGTMRCQHNGQSMSHGGRPPIEFKKPPWRGQFPELTIVKPALTPPRSGVHAPMPIELGAPLLADAACRTASAGQQMNAGNIPGFELA